MTAVKETITLDDLDKIDVRVGKIRKPKLRASKRCLSSI